MNHEHAFEDIIHGLEDEIAQCELCEMDSISFVITVPGSAGVNVQFGVCRVCISLYFEYRAMAKCAPNLEQMRLQSTEEVRMFVYAWSVGVSQAPGHPEHCKSHHTILRITDGQRLKSCTLCGYGAFGMSRDFQGRELEPWSQALLTRLGVLS